MIEKAKDFQIEVDKISTVEMLETKTVTFIFQIKKKLTLYDKLKNFLIKIIKTTSQLPLHNMQYNY